MDLVARVSLTRNCVVQLMPIRANEWLAGEEPLVRNIRREGRAVARALTGTP